MIFTVGTTTALLAPATVLIAIAILICRQIGNLQRRTALAPDWLTDPAGDRYRPMFRLLDEQEVRFLRSQPGATPGLVKRFRRQRCQVFRAYLDALQQDFQTASDALFLVMLHSTSDRRDIVRALIGSRLKFALGIFRVRCRLLLYRWSVGQDSVVQLVGLFEGLQLELLALVPVAEGVSA